MQVDPDRHFSRSDLGQPIFLRAQMPYLYSYLFLLGSHSLLNPSPILPCLVETYK